jgi:uncharacterized protein (TIGR03086 family)
MSFTKTVVLPVTPEDAFALITEPERLRRWQAVSAYVDLRAGGDYRWTITPTHIASGTFREVDPGRRIVFGWGWEGSPELPPDASTVTVTVEPTEGGTLVTLVHEGLSAEQETLHAEGWVHYFDRLEKLATIGDAGPDEWAWALEGLDPVIASYAALATIQPVLRGVSAEDAVKPTPCNEFSCHDLAEHLLSSLQQLGGMAGVSVTVPVDGSLEDRVSTSAAQAIEGWRGHGFEGDVIGPGGEEVPASFAASILPVEILLHGWDLAQGSGQPLPASDELVAYVGSLAEVVVSASRGHSFGAEVKPAGDADALGRLAAYAGRTPMASTT